jgi:hypothetical protein
MTHERGGAMPREDAFNAAKATSTILGGFFKNVVNEIGLEKALSLHAKQGEVLGATIAATVKERLADKEFDMKTFASVVSEFYQMCGYTYELEDSRTSIKARPFQCPFYEGLKNAGLDHQTIEAACSRWVAAELAELKKVFPQLSGRLKFRSASDQPCIEEFELEK